MRTNLKLSLLAGALALSLAPVSAAPAGGGGHIGGSAMMPAARSITPRPVLAPSAQRPVTGVTQMAPSSRMPVTVTGSRIPVATRTPTESTAAPVLAVQDRSDAVQPVSPIRDPAPPSKPKPAGFDPVPD